MTMNASDALAGGQRGNASDVIMFLNATPVVIERWWQTVDYVMTVFEIAPKVGLDPSIVIAQASHETATFTSYWWRERLNPAGLGITGDPEQNAKSHVFRTGEEAARAHLAHLCMYAFGNVRAPLTIQDDPRYNAYVEAYGHTPKARTIADLATTWATDPAYAAGICKHGNMIFRDLSAPEKAPVETPPMLTTANAIVVNGKLWTGEADILVNGHLFHGEPREVHVGVDKLNIREYAGTTSKILRSEGRGTSLLVYGWTEGENVEGESRWWVGSSYSRVWVGGTVEKPR